MPACCKARFAASTALSSKSRWMVPLPMEVMPHPPKTLTLAFPNASLNIASCPIRSSITTVRSFGIRTPPQTESRRHRRASPSPRPYLAPCSPLLQRLPDDHVDDRPESSPIVPGTLQVGRPGGPMACQHVGHARQMIRIHPLKVFDLFLEVCGDRGRAHIVQYDCERIGGRMLTG